MPTSKATCRELVDEVTDYLEGALDPDEKARLDRHLDSCQGCRNYIDQLARLRELTGNLTKSDVAPDAAAALASAFRAWRQGRSV